MTDIIKKIIKFKEGLNNFYLFATMYITDQSILDNTKRMYESVTENSDPLEALNNLYQVLDIICLVISEKEGSSADISNTYILRSTHLGDIYKELDLLSHDLYRYSKSHVTAQPEFERQFRAGATPGELLGPLGIRGNLFTEIDPTQMMPTENYVSEPPAGVKVVTIEVKNTQNLVASIRNIVDSEYVKAKFPNMTTKSGVNEEMIRRYDVIKIHDKTESVEPEIIGKDDRVFQKLSDNLYRELVHYPDGDYVRNLDFIPINNFVTNFENKRIMLLKRSETTQGVLVDNSLPGNIKHKFVNEKKKLDDAIFFTIYKDEMTDDEVVRLGLAATIVRDNLPKNAAIIEAKFDAFINRRTLEKIF